MLPSNDPPKQLFDNPDTAFVAARGVVSRALEANGVKVTTKGTKLIFTVEVGDRKVMVAEYLCGTRTLIWREGASNAQQDSLIRAYVSLSAA
jgi:hypothetical protein